MCQKMQKHPVWVSTCPTAQRVRKSDNADCESMIGAKSLCIPFEQPEGIIKGASIPIFSLQLDARLRAE